MHVAQGLNFVTIVVNSFLFSPKVNIELENSTYVRITYGNYETDYFSRFFLFSGNVTWPGLVKIDEWGIIDLFFPKKEEKVWETDDGYPIKTFSEGRKKVHLPDFYECIVREVKTLSPNHKFLQLLISDRKVYSHIGPGEIVDVKQTIDGEEKISPFPTVPIMPIGNLSFPNPKPGEWKFTMYPINLIVNRNEKKKMHLWLFDRQVGDKVIVGNPKANFTVSWLNNTKYLYLAANDIGLAPMISLLLWTLQVTNETIIYTGVFNSQPNSTFWKTELESISKIDPRLNVMYITGKNLRTDKLLDYGTFRKSFPIHSKNANDSFFCVAGNKSFVQDVKKYVLDSVKLPRNRIHVFKEINEMLEPDKIIRLPLVYDDEEPVPRSVVLKLKKQKARQYTRIPLDLDPREFGHGALDMIPKLKLHENIPLTKPKKQN